MNRRCSRQEYVIDDLVTLYFYATVTESQRHKATPTRGGSWCFPVWESMDQRDKINPVASQYPNTGHQAALEALALQQRTKKMSRLPTRKHPDYY